MFLTLSTPMSAQTRADAALEDYGILDVTQSPYRADPTGERDSTKALQQAVDHARDARMVVYLPPGEYRVSDTIHANQITHPRRQNSLLGRRDDYPCILRGDMQGGRARIVLTDNAPGFGNPDEPKPVIYFLSLLPDGTPDNPNISFNQMIVSLDVELGRGNAGAIAIDHQGAQGCVTEDVHVNADGAFAGLRGTHGSGGSASHVSVQGGRYGLYLAGLGRLQAYAGSQPAPVISCLKLTGQSERSIYSNTRGPLTLVGAEIDGPGIEVASHWGAFNGALNIVDSIVRHRGSGPAIRSNRPVYLNNVYFERAAAIATVESVPALQGSGTGWTKVVEYAAGPSATYPVWIDGATQGEPVVTLERDVPPPADLFRPHRWAVPLPDWNVPGVANVREAPYLAAGDGQRDDTDAIQKALDASRDVFLPKGIYRISHPLRLHANSRLFGIGVHSKIEPIADSPDFADADHPSPMLQTPNDRQAACVAAFFQLWCRAPGSYAIHWQAGRNSIVRNVRTRATPWPKGAPAARGQIVLIDGCGGGRWYNVLTHAKFPQTLQHRHLLVRDTTEPLAFYMLNPEHSSADYMVEFDNVRNANVYSVKSETLGANGPRALTPILIGNSSHFRIFGHGGNACAPEGEPLYRIRNCRDFTLTNFGYQVYSDGADPSTWFMVEEQRPGDRIVRTPVTDCFTLYRRR